MKQQEMIEIIQQEFPSIGETQIRVMLNRALDKFETETELLRGTATVTVSAGKRRYAFLDFDNIGNSDDVLSVNRVDYNAKPIKRYTGIIEEADLT